MNEHQSRPLVWDHGPASFGNLVAGSIVSWSSPEAMDLLVSRCWRGVYLYPSRSLLDEELIAPPVKVCDDLEYLTRATPADWNRDGKDDLILTDRPGFLYLAERAGDFPDISFPTAEPLRDCTTGLIFNIPFENPNYDGPDNQGGYLDPDFFCYAYPVIYPVSGDDGMHLIIGDAAGNLWWMRDLSGGNGTVRYSGIEYEKTGTPMSYGVRYRERFGTRFSKPGDKIRNPEGEPFLLGRAFEGYRDLSGGNSKPAIIHSKRGDGFDLLVLTTDQKAEIHYLESKGTSGDGVPVFEYRGRVSIDGLDSLTVGFHSPLVVTSGDGARMLLHTSSGLAVMKRKADIDGVPAYEFERHVCGDNVPATLYGATEILTPGDGTRYLLDNPGTFRMYPIRDDDESGELQIGNEYTDIRDDYGIFRPEGITDVRTAPHWGVHRAVRWEFDPRNEERQDLIVGADTGHLYLLIAGGRDPGHYRPYGPLEDSNGNIIKIHNRVFPAPIDYYQDGRKDLLLVGANYQMGIAPDPNAGHGFYVCEHLGLRNGLPRLAPPKPVVFDGFTPEIEMNQNPHMQAVDIDNDGDVEVIIAVRNDGYRGRIFSVAHEGGALVYTGRYVRAFQLHQRFLDIDNDGKFERVFAGGETGIGMYEPVEILKE